MAFLVAVGANSQQLISTYGGKCSCGSTRLSGMSPGHGILLLEIAENRVGPEQGGIHRRVDRRLEVFKLIAKGIEEKDDFDLVKIDQAHVCNPSVYG